MDFDEYRQDVGGLIGHLKHKADFEIHPEFSVDAAFERFSHMLKDNSIKAYIKGYSEYADVSNLTSDTHTNNLELQLKVQKFFIDKLHIEMKSRNGDTIADKAKAIGHRMMTIYETERMRSYNWGVFNALKDNGEESYQVYNQSKQSIIDNRKISESKYYDLPPDHPNSKVIIRKTNEDK